MLKVGDRVRSSIVRDPNGTRPELTVKAISKPGATGWTALDTNGKGWHTMSPEEDILVTVFDPIRGEFEVFIDTIIEVK